MFLTQIINGQVTELALCEACARAKGLFDPQSLTFAEKFFPEEFKERMDRIMQELANTKESPSGNLTSSPSPDVLTQCPVCHFSLEDFRRTGRLGCPDCYAVFASELDTRSNNTPAKAEPASSCSGEAVSPALQRTQLEQQLRIAIDKEDYETAALLRDKLKTLD